MNKNAERIGVWGRSGSGKSSWVKARIKGRGRVIVFDPMQEYGDFTRQTIVHRSADAIDQVRQLIAGNPQRFSVAYVPPGGREADALHILCEMLKRGQGGYAEGRGGAQLTLVVEEMNKFYGVRGGAARCPGFADLCSRGRHYGIEIIGVSQRPAEVDTNFRGNCTQSVVFAQGAPQDRAAAAAILWMKEADMPQLQAFEYLHKTDAGIASGKTKKS